MNIRTGMLVLSLISVIPVMGQNRYSKKIDLNLFHELMAVQINHLRSEKELDTLTTSVQLQEVAEMEAMYISEVGRSSSDPYFVERMEGVLGEAVHSSYNSILSAHWTISKIDPWEKVEERMVEGYILQVEEDGMKSLLYKEFREKDSCFTGHIGVNSVVKDGVVFMSIIMYFTCSNIN